MQALAAAVIIYHPDDQLIKRIETYSSFVDRVYIFDNSETPAQISFSNDWEYFYDGENKGVAARLNQGANAALQAGYAWLLTMDQDSEFDDVNMQSFLQCASAFPNPDQVAVFAPVFETLITGLRDCSFTSVSKVITSGSLISLTNFQKLGGFNEKLFIDQVDFDYCYRSVLAKYLIIQFENVKLTHKIGNISEHRSFANFKKTSRSLHSPIRLYYMTRNYFFIKKHYGAQFPVDVRSSWMDLKYRIKNNILYGRSRLMLIKFILKGYSDFRKQKMGKLQ